MDDKQNVPATPPKEQEQQQQQRSHNNNGNINNNTILSSADALFPLENILVAIAVYCCRVCIAAALYIFEFAIGKWMNSNSNSSFSSSSISSNPTSNTNKKKKSLMTLNSSTSGDSNSTNSNSNIINAACMADMIALAVLPYSLASECNTAMHLPSSSSTSELQHEEKEEEKKQNKKEEDTNENSNNNKSKNNKMNKESVSSSSSSSSVLHQQQQKKNIVHCFSDDPSQNGGNSCFKVIYDGQNKQNSSSSKKFTSTTTTNTTKQQVDGIILVLGSSCGNDDVNASCDSPVLGNIAQQLTERCQVVGNLAVVAGRVDFLVRSEPLSEAINRLEGLCDRVCAAFPEARGPLILVARHVTAMLVLHVVSRASRCSTTPTTNTFTTTEQNFYFGDNLNNNNFSCYHHDNGLQEAKPPSLRHASIILFSPFVGWNIPESKSISTTDCSSNNNSGRVTPTNSAYGGDLSSCLPTPQWNTPQKNKQHSNTTNIEQQQKEGILPTNGSFDEDYDFFDYPDNNNVGDAASFLMHGSSTIIGESTVVSDYNTTTNNNDNSNSSNSSGSGGFFFFSSSIRILPSSAFNITRKVSSALKIFSRNVKSFTSLLFHPTQWRLSRIFKLRMRIVGSALWTRMQDVAPDIFCPALRDWFPASCITFLHPSTKCLVVSDSAAPYSVETLHWARKLVSAGCALRVMEWNSSAKDPYSEFQARFTENEGTSWIRDLMIETGVMMNNNSLSLSNNNHSHNHHLVTTTTSIMTPPVVAWFGNGYDNLNVNSINNNNNQNNNVVVEATESIKSAETTLLDISSLPRRSSKNNNNKTNEKNKKLENPLLLSSSTEKKSATVKVLYQNEPTNNNNNICSASSVVTVAGSDVAFLSTPPLASASAPNVASNSLHQTAATAVGTTTNTTQLITPQTSSTSRVTMFNINNNNNNNALSHHPQKEEEERKSNDEIDNWSIHQSEFSVGVSDTWQRLEK